jgi:tetratricopeptide (TPR) repeat protein
MNKLTFLFVVLLLLITLSLDAQKASAPMSEGLIKEKEGKIEEAINYYRGYLEEYPGDHSITKRLMNLLFREERYEEIISVYYNLDEGMKTKRQIQAILGRTYLLLNREKDAVRVLKRIILDEGGTKGSYFYVGNQFMSIGLIEDAKKAFLEGREKWGETSFSRELYFCYSKENDYKRQIREIFNSYYEKRVDRKWVKVATKKVIEKEASLIKELEKVVSGNREYRILTGEILLEIGEISTAKTHLLKADDPSSLLYFASICIEEGYYQEAEQSLRRVLEIDTKTAEEEEALYLLSLSYKGMLRFDDAVRVLNSLIDQSKVLRDSAIVEKARILIYDLQEFEEGVRLMEPLLKKEGALNSDNTLEIVTTGYIKLGNFEKAEDLLKKGNSALSCYLLGEVLLLKGLYGKSREEFLKAVSRGIDKNFANNALERVMIMEIYMEKPSLLSLVSDLEKVLWEEKYDKAIGIIDGSFTNFIKKEERAILLFYKGKIYSLMGQANDAVSSYSSIIGEFKDSPLSAKGLYKAAILCREELKNPSKAKELLRKVIFEYPESVEAKLARGELEVAEHTIN